MRGIEEEAPEIQRRVTAQRWPEYKKLLQHDEEKFKEVLLPLYIRMVDVFRDHLWLADSDVRDFYPKLIGFISMWERKLDGALPAEVVSRMSIKEAELHPFYDLIAARHDRLRNQLRRPSIWGLNHTV